MSLKFCRYYSDSLPRLLDGLQRSEEQRIEVLRSSVMSCVSKEREVSPIIAKCHDTIAAAMHAVDPAKVNKNYCQGCTKSLFPGCVNMG